MEINVSTRFGDIRLVYCYDVSKGTFYDAYDEYDNYLGASRLLPDSILTQEEALLRLLIF